MIEVSIEINPSLDPQLRKLKGYDQIAGRELRKAMVQSAMAVKAGWQGVAPIDTRKYVLNIFYNVGQVVGGEVKASVGTKVTSPKGFPYPIALEEGQQYHYRKTRMRGQQTAGQIAKMLDKRKKQVNKFFDRAAEAITKALK
jgi:hypothetical protein